MSAAAPSLSDMNVPLVAGSVAGGVTLVATALCTFAVYFTRKRRQSRELTEVRAPEDSHWFFLRIAGPQGLETESSIDYTGPTFLVERAYEPASPDEMKLSPGAYVDIRTLYRDG
ncbi:hypothetical protein HDU93_004024, partial [Gonapodya sp. JEL0774]